MVTLKEIDELEYLIFKSTGNSAHNLIDALPNLINKSLVEMLQDYPDSCKMVWSHLKMLLHEKRNRDIINGKGIKKLLPPVPPPALDCDGDPFAYFADREDERVMEYLSNENNYCNLSLSHTATLQKLLVKEFSDRSQMQSETTSLSLGGYIYYSRKEPGKNYQIHCRKKKSSDENNEKDCEEIILDENEIADAEPNCEYFEIGLMRISQCGNILAYGVDRAGNERYTICFKNLFKTEESSKVILKDCFAGLEFSAGALYAYFIVLDDVERAYSLRRASLKDGKIEVLYEEPDEMFCLTINSSADGRFIFVNSSAQVTSEMRFISAEESSECKIRTIFKRRQHVNYLVESNGDHFYVLTNDGVKNNFLFRIPIQTILEGYETEANSLRNKKIEIVVAHRDFVLIEDYQMTSKYLIVSERSNCRQNIRIVSLCGSFEDYYYVQFSESCYSVFMGTINDEVFSGLSRRSFYASGNFFRYTYCTFITPKQVIDYNMDTRTPTIIQEETVQKTTFAYDPCAYVQKRIFATGIDGTAIPISMVYRRDLLHANLSGEETDEDEVIPNPLLLYSYGAYGGCVNPIFSSNRLSLLDRGFIYAIAHVRGGSDMGNGWYEEGKLAKKSNTFTDFISCADFLIKEGYTNPEKLGIYGRSAGGLLIGAVLNMRPELFGCALMEVPFVDVLNTMSDPGIPWTAFEYEEWGNPLADSNIMKAMKSYCPYSNLSATTKFPSLLVVAGLNDPRVSYIEPAKYVAKIRHFRRQRNSDEDNLLLLRVDDAGHTGKSGTFSSRQELAASYAFIITSLNASFVPIPPRCQNKTAQPLQQPLPLLDFYLPSMTTGRRSHRHQLSEEILPLDTPLIANSPLQHQSPFQRTNSISNILRESLANARQQQHQQQQQAQLQQQSKKSNTNALNYHQNERSHHQGRLYQWLQNIF